MEALHTYFGLHRPAIEDHIQSVLGELDPLIVPVASHVLGAGGKRLRPILCVLTAEAFGYRDKEVYPLATALELLHSATLIHDDILDGAALRRGQPSAHLAFGVQETVLAGDALLAMANKCIAGYGQPELMRIASEAIMATANGEIMEIAQLREPRLSEEDYFQIITGKTAVLIQASCECGAVLAGAKGPQRQAAQDLGRNLGIAFQLVDDALDYTSAVEDSGKPIGGDLREGKLTLPLLFYLKSLPQEEAERVLAAIKHGTLDEVEQSAIITAIGQAHLAEATREVAAGYLEQARKALQFFPAGPCQTLLGSILEYVQYRNT
ncbi:polyprenyl synthetase family protein [Desulfohalobium retbaense]|uniref:Dimethylallyltranstransferase n=1 Tax=Desulfohalobium retbaense (strain ATCC 49708 / DSM 5692 / JCM 16813 / HR100) TaxID=485915 RepID=C8X5J7_DESRD|nr:polyprenyl synthetase family protein [Desulfohalobium retbaense]ACV69694.1 Dimethylallyltranstransferase [Desulfohalobium retbaense DSM 5692]